jgi:menaquinone-dependent protoporphyrinogen oxidase
MTAILVVYATRDGQTRKIAERIANVLRVRRHAVELLDAARAPRDLDLSRFQAVFVGSSVHAGGYLRPLVRFVQSHRAQLERTPTLFFSVGLAILSKINDGRAQTMRLVDRLIAETGWHPRRVELLAGALPYTRYNFLIRFVMRQIVKKEGGDTDTSRDYEYTDWAAVDRFAAEFVDEVMASRPTGVPLPRPAMRAPAARA